MDIDKLIKEMTIEEKTRLLSGHKSWHTNPIERLNIPSIFLTDGPHGLRKKKESSKEAGLGSTELSTCFPPAATTACSWNKKLLYEMGLAIGRECNYYDVNVLLGPAINIKRHPLCGRNFEYFSEDPLLTGRLASELTKGIEACNVATSVKHFAANNNEVNRYTGNSVVDERALREIYLKAFEMVIKEGRARTVMSSYNMVNGEFASESQKLLTDILRNEWGFNGVVMSDWGAVNNRVLGVKAGLDLEMPGDSNYNQKCLIDAYDKGLLSLEDINKSVKNILHLINSTLTHNQVEVDFNKHYELAKKLSLDSAVLLKNDRQFLPLTKTKKYLVIGEMFENMRYQGAGSSLINPFKLVSAKEAFAANDIDYEYYQGYELFAFEKNELLHNQAINSANDYDDILFFAGLSELAESEGIERKNLELPDNQKALLQALTALGKRIVLVLFGGSPVIIPCEKNIMAILNMYLPGEAGGEAAYDLLFGNVSPSGRLAETWVKNLNDVPFNDNFVKNPNELYKESILVGYRYYDTFNVPVLYPFGYGLSYAEFSYDNFQVHQNETKIITSVDVTNISLLEASEVVQVYVQNPHSKLIKAQKELKGFTKVSLLPKETKRVSIEVNLADLRHYINGIWVLENGDYEIMIGKNIETILCQERIPIKSNDKILEDEEVYQVYNEQKNFLSLSDEKFLKLFNLQEAELNFSPPYDMNTPLKAFETWGGKCLRKMILFGCNFIYKRAKKGKKTKDQETKIKNAYFAMQMMPTLSLRAMSFASEGKLTYKMALGLLDIANNHFFKGIGKLIIPEKKAKQ